MCASTPNTVPDPADGGVLRVAVAAIVNERGEVLVSRRHPDAHQGGLWEFPGGKIEPGESVPMALAREIHEELGVDLGPAAPLIRIRHDYPDRRVQLEVWRVKGVTGQPMGREGQAVAWRPLDVLRDADFPAANRAIIRALRLPDRYLITPAPIGPIPAFLEVLERALADGVRLVQLRAPGLPARAHDTLATAALALCRRYRARLLINGTPAQARALGADGVHLNSARLMALTARPLDPDHWVAASCHNAAEVAQACRIGVDVIVLGPVAPTASHPGAATLGWDCFRILTEAATVPVYALGGMELADLDVVRRAGGQGIAAIRGLWPQLIGA